MSEKDQAPESSSPFRWFELGGIEALEVPELPTEDQTREASRPVSLFDSCLPVALGFLALGAVLVAGAGRLFGVI